MVLKCLLTTLTLGCFHFNFPFVWWLSLMTFHLIIIHFLSFTPIISLSDTHKLVLSFDVLASVYAYFEVVLYFMLL
jgi:hypothetical protein